MSIDMILPAGSSQTLSLGYSPLHPEFHGGEVLVRCKSPQLSFSIPLTGHGGTSKVRCPNIGTRAQIVSSIDLKKDNQCKEIVLSLDKC